MRKLALLPSAVTSLRIAALPALLYSFFTANIWLSFALLFFCGVTDFADGRLARRLGVNSKTGAMLDVAADFVVILGMFVVFTAEGFYPVWLLGLVVFGFAQFVFSSCLANRLYDPVGKYYGTVLYGAVVLTLLFPIMGVFWFVAVVLSVFTAVSVSSRVAYLLGFLHQ